MNAGGLTRLTHHSLHAHRPAKTSHVFAAVVAVSNCAKLPSVIKEGLID